MALPVEPRVCTLFLYHPVPVGPLAKMSLTGELNSGIIEEGKRLRKSLVEGVVLNYSSCYHAMLFLSLVILNVNSYTSGCCCSNSISSYTLSEVKCSSLSNFYL